MQTLRIDTNGVITAIYNDSLLPLLDEGNATVQRASHVEPAEGGGWTADLAPVGGPVLGPFPKRSQALAEEVAWLQEHVINRGADGSSH